MIAFIATLLRLFFQAFRSKRNVLSENAIYNSLGEVAAALVAGQQQAGEYSVQFDGSNLASGTYFCRLNALGTIETRRVVLMK